MRCAYSSNVAVKARTSTRIRWTRLRCGGASAWSSRSRPVPALSIAGDNSLFGARVNGLFKPRGRAGRSCLRCAALWDEVITDMKQSGLRFPGRQQALLHRPRHAVSSGSAAHGRAMLRRSTHRHPENQTSCASSQRLTPYHRDPQTCKRPPLSDYHGVHAVHDDHAASCWFGRHPDLFTNPSDERPRRYTPAAFG